MCVLYVDGAVPSAVMCTEKRTRHQSRARVSVRNVVPLLVTVTSSRAHAHSTVGAIILRCGCCCLRIQGVCTAVREYIHEVPRIYTILHATSRGRASARAHTHTHIFRCFLVSSSDPEISVGHRQPRMSTMLVPRSHGTYSTRLCPRPPFRPTCARKDRTVSTNQPMVPRSLSPLSQFHTVNVV